MKKGKLLLYILALILAVSGGYIAKSISIENEIRSENLSRRMGTYQLWGGGLAITASVGIDNEFWYSQPGSDGIAETFYCKLEPIDNYLYLINSEEFDYNVVNVKEDTLLLVDTDNETILEIDKIDDLPTEIHN